MRTGSKAGNEEHGSMAPRHGDVAHIEKKDKGETIQTSLLEVEFHSNPSF